MAEPAQDFVVPDGHSGERLDRFLLRVVPGATPEQVQGWIAAGAIRIRGKVPKPLRRLHRGEVVSFTRPEPRKISLVAARQVPILFQSASVVVVNKPPDLAVEPAGRMASVVGSMAQQLRGWDVGGEARPGVVHRLDKETSGCLLLARTDAAVAALHAAFDAGEIEKIYLVLVLGEAAPEGKLDTPYARDAEDPRRYTTLRHSARRARLSWTTLATREGCSLLEVHLDTGRTHQIRVQLSEAGLPVLGDRFYGPKTAREHPLAPGRQALHAIRLAFPNPENGQRVAVQAPLPADLAERVARLRGELPGS